MIYFELRSLIGSCIFLSPKNTSFLNARTEEASIHLEMRQMNVITKWKLIDTVNNVFVFFIWSDGNTNLQFISRFTQPNIWLSHIFVCVRKRKEKIPTEFQVSFFQNCLLIDLMCKKLCYPITKKIKRRKRKNRTRNENRVRHKNLKHDILGGQQFELVTLWPEYTHAWRQITV